MPPGSVLRGKVTGEIHAVVESQDIHGVVVAMAEVARDLGERGAREEIVVENVDEINDYNPTEVA